MSGRETKASTSSSSTEAAEERKERIIKLKRKIEYDAEIIEQIKDDISKMDDNDLKKSLNSTKVALEKEKKDNEDIIKNMSLTPLQQRHAEVQKAKEESKPIGPQRQQDSTFNSLLFGGKRKTKRRRTRRKKRTKRRRRSKKRRARRRKTRRKYGVLEDTDASMQGDRKKKRTKRRHTKKRKSKRRRIR